MRIYVCVKHVPDTAANIRLTGEADFDETVKFIMNPYDEHAVELALQIKEGGGAAEVIAVSVGKEAAVATLRLALAMGADRGILVKTDHYFTTSRETALLLKRAIETDGSPDLILTGKESVDTEGMQVPYHLAALLGMPVVVGVVAFSLAGRSVTVEQEGEGECRRVIEMSMPCVVGAARGLNRPRCPTLPEMMKARKKEIKTMLRGEFDLPCPAGTTELLLLQAVPERGRGVILQETPDRMVGELLRRLREEAKVL
jgi:electron transfer flavoprotein beta subunit